MERRKVVMNKQILSDYIDACAMIKETENEIRRLERKKKTIIQTNVKGSNPNFPYQEQHFKITGTALTYTEDSSLRYNQKVLEEQKAAAEKIKNQVDQWMLTIPARMQRSIRKKYFEGLSWDEVALQMGRKATSDSIKMELHRFLEKK